jgi:uncharacterized protein YjbI with pentapeptide repeats
MVGLILWLAWFIPRSAGWRSTVSNFAYEHPVFVVALIISLVVPFFWLLLWKLPQWQVAAVPEVKDRIDLESKSRQTMAQILGGAALLMGLYFTSQTLWMTQEGQITERFTKAITHLGDRERLTVRLGGIYALERIARDSVKDHWQIMEVLTAYVRENSPRGEEPAPQKPVEMQNVPFRGQVQVPSQGSSDPPIESIPPSAPINLIGILAVERPSRKLATDIQAALTVLVRRRWSFGQGEYQRLNLSQTDLRAADLMGANLRGADLGQADLREARFREADVSEALLDNARLAHANFVFANLRKALITEANCEKTEFGGADLTEAQLYKADLREARLFETTLIRTDLRRVNLRGAFLGSANLTGAQLWQADLRGASLVQTLGLTREQVESAVTDKTTVLPDHLKTQTNPVGPFP